MKATLIGPMRDLNQVGCPAKVARVTVEQGRKWRLVEEGGLQALLSFETQVDALKAALAIVDGATGVSSVSKVTARCGLEDMIIEIEGVLAP